MKEKKFKEIKDSKLLIKTVTKEFRGPDGQKYRKMEWIEPAGEVNLGSLAKPQNEHILEFKWKIPQERKRHPFEGLFKDMLGGED